MKIAVALLSCFIAGAIAFSSCNSDPMKYERDYWDSRGSLYPEINAKACRTMRDLIFTRAELEVLCNE